MKLATKYLGEVEIAETKIIQFPNGLPGFVEEKTFTILDMPNNSAFQIMQSTTTADLAFVITNPHLFYEDYELKLEGELLEQLNINQAEEVVVYAIVTLNNPFTKSTLNLRAPVIINSKELLGKQFILNDNSYSSRAPITPHKEAK